MNTPEVDRGIDEVLGDPAASNWLKTALRESLIRDPVDALHDVLALAGILEGRAHQAFVLGDRTDALRLPAGAGQAGCIVRWR